MSLPSAAKHLAEPDTAHPHRSGSSITPPTQVSNMCSLRSSWQPHGPHRSPFLALLRLLSPHCSALTALPLFGVLRRTCCLLERCVTLVAMQRSVYTDYGMRFPNQVEVLDDETIISC